MALIPAGKEVAYERAVACFCPMRITTAGYKKDTGTEEVVHR